MNHKQIAADIASICQRLGWTFEVRGNIFTIRKTFSPRSLPEFAIADGEYYEILSMLPRTDSGSDWGTDGGGMGALAAIESGQFTMHRSGGSKRVLSSLSKLVK